jgi:hypothetical protein
MPKKGASLCVCVCMYVCVCVCLYVCIVCLLACLCLFLPYVFVLLSVKDSEGEGLRELPESGLESWDLSPQHTNNAFLPEGVPMTFWGLRLKVHSVQGEQGWGNSILYCLCENKIK